MRVSPPFLDLGLGHYLGRTLYFGTWDLDFRIQAFRTCTLVLKKNHDGKE